MNVLPGPGQEKGELLIELVDHIDAMVAYWDIDRVCVFANAAYRDWFGKGRSEIVGTTLKELLGDELYGKNLPFIDAAYRGEKQVFEREIRLPTGGLRSSLATYIPRRVGGQVTGIFVHVADVTALKRLEAELRQAKESAEAQAAEDALTGLPNRRTFPERVDRAISTAARTGAAMALMSIDIDNFKSINDSVGHVEGDRLLVEVASRLKRSLRSSDTMFRLGGDEFVVLVPSPAQQGQVEALARRLVESVRAPVPLGDGTLVPGVSIGIALFPQHGRTREALLAASDDALYAAKAAGRDRYSLAAAVSRSIA